MGMDLGRDCRFSRSAAKTTQPPDGLDMVSIDPKEETRRTMGQGLVLEIH